ncbi:Calx-beta domain-containing protein, partial [Veronia pacifica]
VTEGDNEELSWTLSLNNASATATTLLLDINNLGNKGDFIQDTNGTFTLYSADGNTPLTTVNMSSADKGIVKIVIPAGNQSVQLKTTLNNDAIYEGTETFVLKAAVENTNVWQTASDITINDNETVPTVSSITKLQDGKENAATLDDWPGWNLNMSSQSDSATQVTLAFNDAFNESRYGQDYTGAVHVKFTNEDDTVSTVNINILPPSYHKNISVPANTKSIAVFAEPKDDVVFEGTETLVIHATTDTANVPWTSSDTANIVDNETAPTLLSVGTKLQDGVEHATSHKEGPGWQFTATHASDKDSTITVSFDDSLYNSSFANFNNQIYVEDLQGNRLSPPGNSDGLWPITSTQSGTHFDITLPAGHTGIRVYIKPNDDNIYEGNEQIMPFAVLNGVQANGQIATLNDDDDIPHVQSISDTTIAEGEDAIVTITLSDASNATTRVWIDAYNDSAIGGGQDHQETLYVNFGDGQGWRNIGNFAHGQWVDVPANTTTFQTKVQTANDNVYEGNETFTIRARTENESALNQSGTVTISDVTDKPMVTSVSSPKVWEGDTVEFTVSLSNQSTTSTSVTLDAYNGAATDGSDYQSLMTVNFGDGQGWQNLGDFTHGKTISVPGNVSSFQVRMPTIEDSHYEGGEKFTLRASTEYQSGHVTGTATIKDDELITRGSNGLWDVEDVSKLTLEMQNIYQKPSAGYRSSLGYYLMDNNGNIIKAEVMMGRVASYSSLNVDVSTTGAAKMGLFLIPNGHNFGITNGSATILVRSGDSVITKNGVTVQVLLSESHKNLGKYDNETNSGNQSHWEDLVGGGDKGHDDIKLNIVARPKEYITPLVLDLDGDGVETISVDVSKINYDLDADGVSHVTGWTASDDGFLVWDINQDGLINDGSEMFGAGTNLADGTKARDGIQALAQHDLNADGKIDASDAIYAQLNVWVDANQDGITDPNELKTLAELDITSISLGAVASDEMDNGNLLGLISSYTKSDGTEHEYADVWFEQGQASQPEAQDSDNKNSENNTFSNLSTEQNETTTHDPHPNFEGQAAPGSLIQFTIVGGNFSTRADESGDWKVSLPTDITLVQGENPFTVKITDTENNVEVKAGIVTLDTTPPVIALDNEGGLSEGDTYIGGSNYNAWDAGSIVKVMQGEVEIGETKIDSDGTWKIDNPGYHGGSDVTICITDIAGNSTIDDFNVG